MNSNANNLSADAPTIELDASAIESSSSTNGSSSAGDFQVGVVDTVNRPRFSEETSTLLRSRLQYAALDILVVLSISYVGNFIAANYEWVILRSVVLASVFLILIMASLSLRY